MNRRKFLQWLGIGVPAAAVVATVAPKVEKVVEAKLGEWNNFYSEGDPELMEAIENWKSYPVHNIANLAYDREMVQRLKFENREVFVKLASRNDLHIGASVSRQFFQYSVGK